MGILKIISYQKNITLNNFINSNEIDSYKLQFK